MAGAQMAGCSSRRSARVCERPRPTSRGAATNTRCVCRIFALSGASRAWLALQHRRPDSKGQPSPGPQGTSKSQTQDARRVSSYIVASLSGVVCQSPRLNGERRSLALTTLLMKQVVQNYRTGQLKVEELPPPALRPGGVLVRTACSLISAGTERTIVETAQSSLLGKARSRPDLVRQVVDSVKREGLSSTYEKVKARLSQSKALGYSAAGVVRAVGREVQECRVGDRVACAGGGYASHAEVIFVPRNLCCKLP